MARMRPKGARLRGKAPPEEHGSEERGPTERGPEALRRAIGGGEGEAAPAAWEALGRRAACDGWARRLLLDTIHSRLSLRPDDALPALCELARADPEAVLAIFREGAEPASQVAAGALGRCGGRLLSELLEAARGADAAARLTAMAGLAEAAAGGATEAVEALGQALRDPQAAVRFAAAAGLGRARGAGCRRGAIAHLEGLLEGGDERALAAAAAGAAELASGGSKEAARLLARAAERGTAGRQAVAAALGAAPHGGGAGLARQCARDADPTVRALVARPLARWAAPGSTAPGSAAARGELMRLTRDGSDVVRAAAAGALAATRPLWGEGLLGRLAADRSALVRAAVAEGIGAAGAAGAEGTLKQLCGDRAATVRAAAAGALGAADPGAAREACGDGEPTVRAAGAGALRPETGGEVDLLLGLAQERHGDVARAAARTLCRHAFSPASAAARERILRLGDDPVTEAAATEGLAGALDEEPERAVELLGRWPEGERRARVLWRVARAARAAAVADLARGLARAAEGGEELGGGLRDAALALAELGREDLARECAWAAGCAEAASLEDIGRTVSPPGEAKALVSAARQVGRALRAPSAAGRERCRSAARAALDPGGWREEGTAWAPVRELAARWGRLLGEAAGAEGPADVRAGFAPERLIAGEKPTALVEVENAGPGAAHEVTVEMDGGGGEGRPRSLAAGERARVAVALPPTRPGRVALRGRLRYRDASGAGVKDVEAALDAVAPGELRAVANPYVVGKPLGPESEMFFGRGAEMEFVERALGSGREGAVAVLVGPRRTGKTSLLKRLEARLSGPYLPAFVDVQGLLVADTNALFRELADRARLAGAGEQGRRADPWSSAPSRAAGAEMVQEAAASYGQRVVLLLDEFDDLEHKVRTGVLEADVFSQLRHLIQHGGNVSLVLSGTNRLEELAGEHWSFLLNLAAYRRVGCLGREVAEEVIRAPMGRLGIMCEEAAVARAVQLTGRHPYFLQLLGYRLVERCVERGEAAVRVGLVEAAAEEVVEQGEIHLRYLWEGAGSQGRLVLRALAEEESGLTREELGARTGLGRGHVERAVKGLKGSELVEEQEAVLQGGRHRGARLQLQIGLLSEWLKRQAQPEGGPGRGRLSRGSLR